MEEARKFKLKHRLLKILKWVVGIAITGFLLVYAIAPFLFWALGKLAFFAGIGLGVVVLVVAFLVVLFGGCA